MIEEIPWTVKRIPQDNLDEANDLGSEGWQPFAVADGHIYFRRVGTSTNRIKIPVSCGTCKHFAPVGQRVDNDITYGFCKLRKHATNEDHYCEEYETIYE